MASTILAYRCAWIWNHLCRNKSLVTFEGNRGRQMLMRPSIYSEQFGVFENNAYVVPAYWQSLWNAIPQLTTGLGAWLSGPISDRFGRRWSLFIAGVLSIIGVAIVYTSSTPPIFLIGKMVNSLGLGAALAAGQTYVSEITPRKIRGIALSMYTVCLVCIAHFFPYCFTASRPSFAHPLTEMVTCIFRASDTSSLLL